MIIIPDKLRRPAEVEREELRKQLSEARAEIERLKSEHEDSLRRAKDNAVSLSGTVTEYAGELFAKGKLIEQMREALTGVCEVCPCDTAKEDKKCQDCDIRAALSAAERGE